MMSMTAICCTVCNLFYFLAYAEMIARCTICLTRIYPLAANTTTSALKHPILDVLICRVSIVVYCIVFE